MWSLVPRRTPMPLFLALLRAHLPPARPRLILSRTPLIPCHGLLLAWHNPGLADDILPCIYGLLLSLAPAMCRPFCRSRPAPSDGCCKIRNCKVLESGKKVNTHTHTHTHTRGWSVVTVWQQGSRCHGTRQRGCRCDALAVARQSCTRRCTSHTCMLSSFRCNLSNKARCLGWAAGGLKDQDKTNRA